MKLRNTLALTTLLTLGALAAQWGSAGAKPAPSATAKTKALPDKQTSDDAKPAKTAAASPAKDNPPRVVEAKRPAPKKHPGGPKFDEMNEQANLREKAESNKQLEAQKQAQAFRDKADSQKAEALKSQDTRLQQLRVSAKDLKPKLSVPIAKAPVRAAKSSNARSFKLRDTTNKGDFEIVLRPSGWVDERLVDYLQGNLEISPYTPTPGRADEPHAWHDKEAVDGSADEIAVEMTSLTSGVDVARYAWSWPSGFELARPGVLRVRPELVEAFSKTKAKLILLPLPKAKAIQLRPGVIGKLPVPPGGPTAAPTTFSSLQLRVTCRASDSGRPMSPKPLPFVSVRVGSASKSADSLGRVTLDGTFTNSPQTVDVTYDSNVESFGQRSVLRIMAEVHSDSRHESASASPSGTSGSTLVLGDVELSSVDCETWRLGEGALSRYHELVQKSPPAGRLEIKRWTVDWGGTPYTFYNHLVLTEKWTEKDSYVQENWRRHTVNHEFGHSVRHVADGDVHHWNWDNFRWVYARSHSGCEVFNTQYAFNEGWAGYWANMALNSTPNGCTDGPSNPVHSPETRSSSQRAKFVDWVEDMVDNHLYQLSEELKHSQCSGASDRGACAARKMVEVLERYPGEIHSLWEFEQHYCTLHFSGNALCQSQGVPTRAAPAACPPGFTDDGATCRLHQVVAKSSYGRDVGQLPTNCGSRHYEDGLCYADCPSGYGGAGPICWEHCPSSYRDDGAFCAKPEPYGRGTGYPWQFGDSLNLDGAYGRCQAEQGAGHCEEWGAIVYPKCRSGFHNVACCICSPDCPSGMTDIGVSCAKRTYDRGVGTIPTACAGGMQYDTGLCYPQCRAGFTGAGPVCWGQCPQGFTDQGALCARPDVPWILVKY